MKIYTFEEAVDVLIQWLRKNKVPWTGIQTTAFRAKDERGEFFVLGVENGADLQRYRVPENGRDIEKWPHPTPSTPPEEPKF